MQICPKISFCAQTHLMFILDIYTNYQVIIGKWDGEYEFKLIQK